MSERNSFLSSFGERILIQGSQRFKEQKHQKPFIVGSLKNHTGELVEEFVTWLQKTMPGVLNIAGPHESESQAFT